MEHLGIEIFEIASFCRFSAILLHRGRIFSALQQPARAQRDLRAAQDMGAAGAERWSLAEPVEPGSATESLGKP